MSTKAWLSSGGNVMASCLPGPVPAPPARLSSGVVCVCLETRSGVATSPRWPVGLVLLEDAYKGAFLFFLPFFFSSFLKRLFSSYLHS